MNAKGLDEIAFLTPLSLSFPWNMHGFNGGGLTFQQSFLSLNGTQLSGNQMALANLEIRLPFTGPERLAIIPFKFVPSDLNLFFDLGTVWDKSQTLNNPEFISFKDSGKITNPVFSTGISLRVNVLGYVILEPYMAIPFINGKSQPVVTGMNFMIPGW